jgi:DNA-binding beta-propeller fold protein YncE
VLAALLVPATAAAQGGPRVLRVDPTTGGIRVLAAGAPWTTLGGLAVGPTGTLYVANQSPPGPRPRGGIYSLTAPGFAITPVATTAPTAIPMAVVSAGSSLFSLDEDRVLAIGTTSPLVQRIVTSGGLYDQYGANPQFGALSGTTLYTTASESCQSAEGGGEFVIAVDTTTGMQSLTKRLGCAGLGGIAVTPTGTLLVAQASRRARIVELNPATGAVTTVTSGGSLEAPQGIALDAAGDILVADLANGVVAVSRDSGEQSPVTARGAVNEAAGIAVGADGGIYVSDGGVPPRLRASAAKRQRFRSSGIAFTAGCNRRCVVGYAVTLRFPSGSPFNDAGAFRSVSGRRTLRVKLPRRINRRIARTLRQGRTVGVKLNLSAGDPRSGVAAKRATLRLRLV